MKITVTHTTIFSTFQKLESMINLSKSVQLYTNMGGNGVRKISDNAEKYINISFLNLLVFNAFIIEAY